MSSQPHEHHWIFAEIDDKFDQVFVCEFMCGATRYVKSFKD